MPQQRLLFITFVTLLMCGNAWAGKLALVIDDLGYRQKEQEQVLKLPFAVSIAILPNAPMARQMALRAHQQGREVLIHLPMAPLTKQPLEKDTLRSDMSQEEISRIIDDASHKVPYASGLNNHMGSAMTSSLTGMEKIMQVLGHYNYYFLDSMTIGTSQATRAATGTNVRVLKRRVFLDDNLSEASIRQQFARAVRLARRDGSAIAIGHPHTNTLRVLQQMIPELPADITLVRPSQLLNQITELSEVKRHSSFRGIQTCMVTQPLPAVPAGRALTLVSESLYTSPFLQKMGANLSGLHINLSSLKTKATRQPLKVVHQQQRILDYFRFFFIN